MIQHLRRVALLSPAVVILALGGSAPRVAAQPSAPSPLTPAAPDRRLAPSPLLDQNGVLYIGHSERVTGAAVVQTLAEGTTTYRKRIAAAA